MQLVIFVCNTGHNRSCEQRHWNMLYSPIQTSLNTFVANCRNLVGVWDGSDRLVSTPGAPNIRIVPSIVPVESDDIPQTKRDRSNSPIARMLETGSKAKMVAFKTWSSVLSVPTSQSCLSRKSVERSVRDLPILLNIVYLGHGVQGTGWWLFQTGSWPYSCKRR